MSHEIEGNKAFFTGQAAWHGLGHVLTDAPTADEAWRLAYPHTFLKMDLEAVIKTDDGQVHRMPLENSKVIIRDDGKEFNTVGAGFELVQPMEAFKAFKPLLDSGLCTLEAGGSLRDGAQMWALAKIKGAETNIIPGDTIKGYVNLFTGFDGRLQMGINQTNIRVVCANTLAMATGIGNGGRITKANKEKYGITTFKHTKNIRLRLDDAIKIIKCQLEEFNKSVEAYKVLAAKKTTSQQLRTYVRHCFLTEDEITGDKEISARKENTLDQVTMLLDTQRGLDLVPAIRGTAWQGYNAVTQYLTHDYGRSADTRINSLWYGENAGVNKKALELALAM